MIDHARASADSLCLSADIDISSNVRFLVSVQRLIEHLASDASAKNRCECAAGQ